MKPQALPGGRIKDLRGETFGLLEVRHFAGVKSGHAWWCCACKCLVGCKDCHGGGCSIKIPGTKLVCGKALSCGCSRTDPEIRRRAALRVPVRVRKARAQAAAAKCKGSHPPPAYRLTLARASHLLGIEPEAVLQLSRDGAIRSTYHKGGRLRLSARDVADYIADHARDPKACPMAGGEDSA